jgi:2-dehydropantoate 2-reductase
MKIAVVGTGAVGSYYGAKLARDGHEVHFLLRSDYERVKRHGVRILSPEGDFTVRPKAAKSPVEIGRSDLVLIALKTTANVEFPRLLPPLVDSRTAILTLQNGLGNEEALAEIFPVEQILGGLCFVCLNRIEPGVIRHIAHGKIVLGEYRRYPEPRTHDIASAIRHSGVPCSVSDNLERAHWEKLIWNIPFNGLTTASCAGFEGIESGEFKGGEGECLTTDKLLSSPDWSRIVRELMLEVIAIAKAYELVIPVEFADEQIARTRVMEAYKPSTMIDYLNGLPIELESLFFEPVRRAERKGVAVPRLRALCQVLKNLNERLNVHPTK